MNDQTSRPALADELSRTRLVAVVRGRRADHLQAATRTLVEAGVECLEVTLNTPGALDLLRSVDMSVGSWGAGTVLTADEVGAVADAGGTFCVAPNVDEAVGEACHRHGLAWFPGAATPTEIIRAWNAGAAAVKVFPAGSLGGPAFIKDVLAPLDGLPLIPTGGVNAANAGSYLDAGAVAVGLGGSLIGDALETGDMAGLGARAQDALAVTRRP